MALCGAVAWIAVRAWPDAAFALPLRMPLTALLVLAGLLCNLLPKLAFGRAGTTVNPLRPRSSRVLVTTGLHRWSRNPMYLGHAVLLLAWALWLRRPAAFAAIPAYVAWVTRFQIVPEERALTATFGQAYLDYRRRVRRWL